MKKIITTVCAVTAMSVWAKIEMGAPFVDGVILQRDRAVPVWGNADAGKKVTVEFAGNSASAIAGQDGKWMVKLPAMKASKESRVMTVVAGDEKLSINDVLVGEVWMCAGQSNTECPVWGINPRYRDGQGATVILMVNKPHVRFVNVPRAAAVSPVNNVKTKWVKMTPELFKDCEKRVELPSAMGYYFALELVNALDIPIAVVDASWGGTNIDAWTPRSGYDGMDSLKDVASLPVLNEKDFGVSRKEGVYKGKGVYGGWVQQPTALWNAMVAAYTPMACRGLIWYQGCHNGRESERYCDKMHALYKGWSKEFANPDLKLYFVQLAPFRDNWMGLVEAQNKFAAEEKNAAIVVTSDVGNFYDVHPNDKRTVGRRLAFQALARDYGFDWIKPDSPTFKSAVFSPCKVEMTFNNADSWYIWATDCNYNPPFEIAGEDGKWHSAKLLNVKHGGTIVGTTLTLTNSAVAKPVKVRYMGQPKTSGTLFNNYALPLGPFTSK